jgi:dienelactone hydrolase
MRLAIHSVVALTLCASLPAQEAKLLRYFDYDSRAPLDQVSIGTEKRGTVIVHDISYASPKGGRVPAYLVVPGGDGPFAAVVWGHWYMPGSEFLNRREFLAEAVALAPAGVVSLLIDGPITRPGYVADHTPLNEQQVRDRVQAIVDVRRGVDLLLVRTDIDPRRVAYVGHSYNAETGAFLAGIDRRFKAFVLMAGALSDEITLRSRELKAYRRSVGPERFDRFVAQYAWLDQGKYVKHAAPAVVLLQYGSREAFLTPKRAREYAAVVSEPKRFRSYDAPHALNAEARKDRFAFLTEQLSLKPVPPWVIDAVPDLVQPTDHKPDR